MGDLLAELFSSRVRAAVLGHVLPRPHLAFSLTDLSRRLEVPISSLQHECYKLERVGILYGRREGGSRRYRIDPDCPVRGQLAALVVAGIGPEAALRGAVDNVPGLEAAFLAGAGLGGAPGGNGAGARLVLVGDLALEDLDGVLARAEAALGPRPGGVGLDLVFFRAEDWRAHVADGNAYVAALLAAPRLDLVGSDGAGAPGAEGGPAQGADPGLRSWADADPALRSRAGADPGLKTRG